MSVRNPVVIKKPVNIARPSKLPMKDILIRRSFDFSRRIKSRKIVVLRLAIFAALITQRGFGSNICSQNFGLFWRMKRRIVDLQQKSKRSYLKNNHKAHRLQDISLIREIFLSRLILICKQKMRFILFALILIALKISDDDFLNVA